MPEEMNDFSFTDYWSTDTATDKKHSKEQLIKDRAISSKFVNKVFERIQYAQNITKKPVSGEQIRIVTQRSFNAISLIGFLLDEETAIDAYLAIYRIDIESVKQLIEWVNDGKVKKCKIVLSSFFRTSKKSEVWHNLLLDASRENPSISVFYCWNHAKVFIANTDAGNYYIMEGSGNLSENARIEQYILENNKEVYSFHKEWITEVMEGKHY